MELEIDTLNEEFEVLPASETLTELNEPWRWRSKDSDGWQPVQNEEHARLLIRTIDEAWPWIVIEKGQGVDYTFAQVMHAPGGGMIIEVNSPLEWVSRVVRPHDKARQITLDVNGLMMGANTNEVFNSSEAVNICLGWLRSRSIPDGYSIQKVS